RCRIARSGLAATERQAHEEPTRAHGREGMRTILDETTTVLTWVRLNSDDESQAQDDAPLSQPPPSSTGAARLAARKARARPSSSRPPRVSAPLEIAPVALVIPPAPPPPRQISEGSFAPPTPALPVTREVASVVVQQPPAEPIPSAPPPPPPPAPE